MKYVKAPDTVEGPWTVDDCAEGRTKKVFYVRTDQVTFVANSLDKALKLWAEESWRTVLDVESMG